MSDEMETDKVRRQVREWLSENWHGVADAEWRLKVVLAGWAAPTFPKDAYGHDLHPTLAKVVLAEFDAVSAPFAAQDLTIGWVRMAGMAVARYGGASLKETFIRDLLSGKAENGTALYSEPSAGSDLASLQTRAVRDGEEWIVNGQKIWSSLAADAQWGLLLTRTNDEVPKQQGISFFVLPMPQPGIEIRPIKQINGDAEFNEVFLTDARVPVGNILGEVDGGWAVLQDVLAAERTWLGEAIGARGRRGEGHEVDRSSSPDAGGAEDLIDAARKAGRADDAAVRQTIAHLHSWRMVHQWGSERLMNPAQGEGFSPVAAAALGKLAASRILHGAARFKTQMLGPEAMLYGAENVVANTLNREVMSAFISSVGGGSDQIQRNIISERLLGLPRGFAPDRGVPFKDIKKSTVDRRLANS